MEQAARNVSSLLFSRYQMPTLPENTVKRERLMKLLREHSEARILFAHAPAGYGKTTAVRLWTAGIAAPTAWFSIGIDADDPIRFWAYIVAALAQENKGFPKERLLSELYSGNDCFENELLNAISAVNDTVALVIDDFHLLTNDEIFTGFEYFCRNLPDNMRLVVASRRNLPFSLAKKHISGELFQLTERELSFDAQELAHLSELRNLRLSADDAQRLLSYTGGWPVGIALALLQVKRNISVSTVLREMHCPGTLAGEYISGEMLCAFDDNTREYLMLCSLLPTLSAELCSKLMRELGKERLNSEELLNKIWQDGGFIQRVRANQYICHALIRDTLKAQFKKESPQEYIKVGTVAATLLDDAGAYFDAIDTAVETEMWSVAAELILKRYGSFVMDGEAFILNRWLGALPIDIFAAYPKLHIVKAWALLPGGKTEEANEHLGLAQQSMKSGEPSDEDSVAGEIAALRALNYAMIYSDSKDSLRYAGEGQVLLRGDGSSELAGNLKLSSAISHLLDSEPSQAEAELKRMLSTPEDRQSVFTSFFGRYYMAMMEEKRGKLHRSESLLKDAILLSRNDEGRERSIAGMAHMSLARIYYEWNRLDDCLEHVRTGIAMSKDWSLPTQLSSGYHTMSLLGSLQGNIESALEASMRAYELSASGQISYATPLITHASLSRLRKRTSSENMDGSLRWAEQYLYGIRDSERLRGDMLWKAPAAVYLSAAEGAVRSSNGVLTAVTRAADDIGFYNQVIETHVLRSMLSFEEGNVEKALLSLTTALKFAQYEGYMRIFLDEGKPMYELLQEARRKKIVPVYTDTLLSSFKLDPQPEESPLSDRETDVLRMLSEGCSPKQIAQRLYISIGTTRIHLHHIYEKLGAENQVSAIAIAREKKYI